MAPKRAGSMKWVAKGAKDGEDAEFEPEKEVAAAADEAPEEEITSPLVLETFTGPNYSAELLLRIRLKLGVPEPATEEELTAHPYKFEDRILPESTPAVSNTRERKKVSRQKSNVTADEAAPAAGDAAAADTVEEVARTVSLSEATKGDSTPMRSPPAMDPWMNAYIQSMQYAAAAMPPLYAAMGAGNTTIMLRNIPNRYTRDMLVKRLDDGYKDQYDFVYLPIDFNSNWNVGYGFINFRTPAICQRFVQEFNGQKTRIALPGFSSQKVCEVTYARVQGRDANMENLKDEKFMEKLNERPEWQPLFLDDNGKEIPLTKVFAQGQGTGKGKKSKGNDASSPAAMGMAAGMPGFFPPAFGAPMVPPPWMMGASYGQPVSQDITLAAILPNYGPQTTLMLRNVPIQMTRAELIAVLNKDLKGSYDFLYLPVDTRTAKEKERKDKELDAELDVEKEAEPASTEESPGNFNRGFAFINLRTVKKGKAFQEKFDKVKVSEIFPGVESDKDCAVVPARINTLEKSLNRLKADVARGQKTTGKWPEWYPILLGTNGELYPFPLWPRPAGYPPAAPSSVPLPPVPAAAVDARSLEEKMETEARPEDASAEKGASSTATAEASSADAAKEAKPGLKLPVGAGYAPQPYGMGYPGMGSPVSSMSPVHAHAMAAAMAAASAAAQVQMQIYSSQASAQQAAVAVGLLDPLAEAVNPSSQTLSDADKEAVRQQIEYYFGTDNLCKDTYLRSNMDSEGWVDLKLIAGFNKVKAFRVPPTEIAKALAQCEILELDPEVQKVRLKNEEKRKEFGNAFQASATPEAPASSEKPS